MGQELAKVNNAVWIETSSKNNFGVGQYELFRNLSTDLELGLGKVFELCIREILKHSMQNSALKPLSVPPVNKRQCIIM